MQIWLKTLDKVGKPWKELKHLKLKTYEMSQIIFKSYILPYLTEILFQVLFYLSCYNLFFILGFIYNLRFSVW